MAFGEGKVAGLGRARVLACVLAVATASARLDRLFEQSLHPARLSRKPFTRLRGGAASAMAQQAGSGTLYLIGLGLGDEKDITVKGLETVRRCKVITCTCTESS